MFCGRLRLGTRFGNPSRFEFGADNIEGHIRSARIQPSGAGSSAAARRRAAQFKQHDSEIVNGVGLVGIQFHGLLQLGAAVLEAMVPQISQSEIVVT